MKREWEREDLIDQWTLHAEERALLGNKTGATRSRVFRELRKELEIEVERSTPRLPNIPTEEEIRAFYQQVWQARKFADMILIKTLFYTGIRVSELVNIRLEEVDLRQRPAR
ncbi:hypothetical protein [Ktedonobacter robiniae]|nr:hypothetical protein [Ktedonobacter robiniae]